MIIYISKNRPVHLASNGHGIYIFKFQTFKYLEEIRRGEEKGSPSSTMKVSQIFFLGGGWLHSAKIQL